MDSERQEQTIGLKWHSDIEKVASFGNDHYFALVNSTPWTISITSGLAGDHKNGLNFARDVEPQDCYVHVCSKLGWTFSAGGTFCVKADPKDVNDVQFVDFALSNPIVSGRKIRTLPVDKNEYGARAWKTLAKTDKLKTFTYHDEQCVVKGEIQPGQSGCFVWKFCIQVLEGVKVIKQPQQWIGDCTGVKFSVGAQGIGTLSYQWKKEGEEIDSVKYPNCSGVNSATLSISRVTSEYEGKYSCSIEDETGQTVESDPINVKVPTDAPDSDSPDRDQEAIKITKQPQTLKFDSNGATIGVCATGPGTLSYTWMKDGEAITSDKYPYCSGVHTDTLTISPFTASYEGDYYCVIKNDNGLGVESDVTSLKRTKGLSRSPKSLRSRNPIKYAAQKLQKKAEEWEENFVVQAAKRLANLMKEMDKYTTQNEFDEKELSDLLSRIIEISKEMVKVANRAAEACPNRLPKQDVLKQVEIIELAVNFLEVLASVNASRLKGGDTDAKEKLTRNATQLLDAVGVIIQAIDTATITLSDEAREKLDLPKWVKLKKQRESMVIPEQQS